MAVPVNNTPQPPSHPGRALHDMEVERKRNDDERITGWTVIWVLFVFKMATVALIWFAANGSRDDGAKADHLLIVTTWYWLLIPAVAFSGFAAHRLRLRAARKRVAELRHAEFSASTAKAPVLSSDDALTDDEKERLRAFQSRRERM